jgi:hypothetical protein
MPQCVNGHRTLEGKPFCGTCGAPAQVACPNGHAVHLDNQFCNVCGAGVAETATDQSATTTSTQPGGGRSSQHGVSVLGHRYRTDRFLGLLCAVLVLIGVGLYGAVSAVTSSSAASTAYDYGQALQQAGYVNTDGALHDVTFWANQTVLGPDPRNSTSLQTSPDGAPLLPLAIGKEVTTVAVWGGGSPTAPDVVISGYRNSSDASNFTLWYQGYSANYDGLTGDNLSAEQCSRFVVVGERSSLPSLTQLQQANGGTCNTGGSSSSSVAGGSATSALPETSVPTTASPTSSPTTITTVPPTTVPPTTTTSPPPPSQYQLGFNDGKTYKANGSPESECDSASSSFSDPREAQTFLQGCHDGYNS